jgi:hypothetical protein
MAEHLVYGSNDRKASAALAEAKVRIPALKAGVDHLGVSGTKASKFVADMEEVVVVLKVGIYSVIQVEDELDLHRGCSQRDSQAGNRSIWCIVDISEEIL